MFLTIRRAALVLMAVVCITLNVPVGHTWPGEKKRNPVPRKQQADKNLPLGVRAILGSPRLRHGGRVSGMAFTPKGELVTVAESQDHVFLWEVPSGKLLRKLPKCRYTLHAVAVSPDGRRVVSTMGDGSVQMQDMKNGKFIWKRKIGNCRHLAFSPDGKKVACAVGKTAYVIDPATGKLFLKTMGQGNVTSVAFSADGQILALADERRIALWSMKTWRKERSRRQGQGRVLSVAFTPDNRKMIVATSAAVYVWDVKTWKPSERFLQQKLWPEQIAVSPDGKLLGVPVRDGSIILWDLKNKKVVRRLQGSHVNPAVQLVFSPDGKTLAAAAFLDYHVSLWNVATGKCLVGKNGHNSWISAVAVSPDSRWIITASQDKSLVLWEAAAGKKVRVFHTEPKLPFADAAFSPDGKTIAAACTTYADNQWSIWLWNAATGKPVQKLARGRRAIKSIAFSPDGKLLASGGRKAVVKLWDVKTGKKVRQMPPGRRTMISKLAFSPDGKILFGAHHSYDVDLWDATRAKKLDSLRVTNVSLFDLAVAPDGSSFIVSGARDEALLWDLEAKKVTLRFPGHDGYAFSLALSPDGRMLATAGRNEGLHLWELASGKRIARLDGHNAVIRTLAFSPDGKLLVSGSSDTTVIVWDLAALLTGDQPVGKLSDKQLDQLRLDLAGNDAGKAYRAIYRLAHAPKQAIALFKKELKPAKERKQIAALIAKLDADTFKVRETAMLKLSKMGRAAEPYLRDALKNARSLEMRVRLNTLLSRFKAGAISGLRQKRIVAVLELIDTPQARALLKKLSELPESSMLGKKARAAVERGK